MNEEIDRTLHSSWSHTCRMRFVCRIQQSLSAVRLEIIDLSQPLLSAELLSQLFVSNKARRR